MTSTGAFNGCRQVVLIACGSFNPPTIMHMRMFECARDYLQNEVGISVVEGIFSPTADDYGKPDLAKAQDRLNMCALATKGSSWLRADGWECTQKTWTRTVEVLRHHLPLVREKHSKKAGRDRSDVALVLLCGGDVVDSFTAVRNGKPVWSPEDVDVILGDFAPRRIRSHTSGSE